MPHVVISQKWHHTTYNIQLLLLLTIIGQRPTVVDRRNPSLSRSFRFYGHFIRSPVACRYCRETCTVFSSLRFICVSVCLDWRPRFLYSSSSNSSRPQRCPTCICAALVCVFPLSFGGKSSERHRGMFPWPHWRTGPASWWRSVPSMRSDSSFLRWVSSVYSGWRLRELIPLCPLRAWTSPLVSLQTVYLFTEKSLQAPESSIRHLVSSSSYRRAVLANLRFGGSWSKVPVIDSDGVGRFSGRARWLFTFFIVTSYAVPRDLRPLCSCVSCFCVSRCGVRSALSSICVGVCIHMHTAYLTRPYGIEI